MYIRETKISSEVEICRLSHEAAIETQTSSTVTTRLNPRCSSVLNSVHARAYSYACARTRVRKGYSRWHPYMGEGTLSLCFSRLHSMRYSLNVRCITFELQMT